MDKIFYINERKKDLILSEIGNIIKKIKKYGWKRREMKIEEWFKKLSEDKQLLVKRAVALVGALAFTLIVGLGGWAIGYYAADPATRTVRWVTSMVKDYYYREFTEEQITSALVNGTLFDPSGNGLLDKYSVYYTKAELEARNELDAGNNVGVGIALTKNVITQVFGNSSAEKSGLKAGMYLLGYGLSDSADEMTSVDDSGFSDFYAEREEDETFYLFAATENDPSAVKAYPVCRKKYNRNYVFYFDSDTGYRFVGEEATEPEAYPSPHADFPTDTAMIKFESFAGNAAKQFAIAVEKAKASGRGNLILDLRGNGGGQMSILLEIAQYLCRSAPAENFDVALINYRNEKKSAYRAPKNLYSEYLSEINISVMADCDTASASEALIGAMLDYETIDFSDVYVARLGAVERTYGKGIMQSVYQNPFTGEGIKLTTATVNWPVSNRCIHGTGIAASLGATVVDGSLEVGLDDPMLNTVLSYL